MRRVTADISVIIPAFNEAKCIEACLKSLVGQGAQVIVVDNESTDDTFELARKYTPYVYVTEGKLGKVLNFGASLAEGEIVAFIDADSIADENWVKEIERSFEEADVTSVIGLIKTPLKGRKTAFVYGCRDLLQRIGVLIRLPYNPQVNFACLKEAFFNAGGYSETVEVDHVIPLALKLHKEGKITYNKKMIVIDSPRRYIKYGFLRVILQAIINRTLWFLTGRNLGYSKVR